MKMPTMRQPRPRPRSHVRRNGFNGAEAPKQNRFLPVSPLHESHKSRNGWHCSEETRRSCEEALGGRAVDAGEPRGRAVPRNLSSAECDAGKEEMGKHADLALPLRSPSNDMEFSGERSESAATTG